MDEIKWEGFGNVTHYPIESLGNSDFTKEIKYVHIPLTFSGAIIFHYKKMSRKKFKKWLMHLPGHNRNYAENWCRIIKLLNRLVSYGESYQAMTLDPSGLLLLDSITIKLEETK